MPHVYGAVSSALIESAQKAAAIAAQHASEVDTAGRYPEEAIQALGQSGLMGLTVPRSHGGLGEGMRAFAVVAETLAGACSSTAMIYVMHISATQAIVPSKTLAERDALLRAIAAGKHLTTLAFSEKGTRSNFWAPASKLVERGPGLLTQAFKSWVTSAHRADSYVSSAQRPGAQSPLESTLYLVRNRDGVRPGGNFDGLGLRGNDSAPLSFEELPVAREDLLTDHGAGAAAMLEAVLPWFCVGTAAMANGLCRASLDAICRHAQEASIEGVGKLRDLPQIRARVAQMSVRTEQARSLLGYTLGELEAPSATTPLYVLQTRAASIDAALEVTDLAMKAGGGAAFSKKLPVERWFRDARAGWVMAPTVDHLHDFVGKALTGLPLF